MKIDINQDTLLEHDRVTMPFIRIDPRGGMMSKKNMLDGIERSLRRKHLLEKFYAKKTAEHDTKDQTGRNLRSPHPTFAFSNICFQDGVDVVRGGLESIRPSVEF